MANRFGTWFSVAILGGAACATVAGCAGDEPAACPGETWVRGVCAGVPAGAICGDERCTAGVECTKVIDVGSDLELASAAQDAEPGTCIALRSGRYHGVVNVRGDVSLLGRSASAVEIEGIRLTGGEGAVVRGLTVGREGVKLQEARGVRLESVRVVGEKEYLLDGVELGNGASIVIRDSEIVGSGRVGVLADHSDVTLERSVISGAQRGGIVLQGPTCEQDCECTSGPAPALEVKNSVLYRNHVIGISLRHATATLEGVDVLETRVGGAGELNELGGGISAAECSNIQRASKVRVLDSATFGVLVDRSRAALGDADEDDSIEISRNTRGLWIQNACKEGRVSCVSLHNGKLDGNFGVGIGISGESRGIILCKSAVTATKLTSLPVIREDGALASDDVGDGVDWLEQSEVTIELLTLSGNARQSLLIDGPARGEIRSLDFKGDADKPPVHQNYTEGARPSGEEVRTTPVRERSIPEPQIETP